MSMTHLLDEAVAEVAKLPPQEQDVIAHQILEELRSEQQWNEQFSESQDLLAELADEALQEHRDGHTQDLMPKQ